MTHHDIIIAIYTHFIGQLSNNVIPINLRAPSLVGTTQDDPFDSWVGGELKQALPEIGGYLA